MEENEETKESKKDKILLASIAVILILSLIVTNVEFEFSEMYTYIDSVPRQTTEIYEKSVSYTETVPAIKTEYYFEKVPFVDEDCKKRAPVFDLSLSTFDDCLEDTCVQTTSVCIDKNIWGNCVKFEEKCEKAICTKMLKSCDLTFKNEEQKEMITLSVTYGDLIDEKVSITQENRTLYIGALDEYTVSWDFEYFSGDRAYCHHGYSFKLIEECTKFTNYKEERRAREVPSTKEITKWKKEPAVRDVTVYDKINKTKERVVEKTILNYIKDRWE